MSTHKRINGNYYIDSIDPAGGDNVIITTHTVQVNGNLDVVGNVTYISSSELDITDPFITLAANNNGAFSNAGILTQKTSSPNTYAGLRYNMTDSVWQVSTDNSSWSDIAVGNVTTPAAGSNTEIQFNNGGAFGASANLTFDTATNTLTIVGNTVTQGKQVLGNIGTAPSSVANSVALYHNQQGGGGTGVYVKSSTVEDELVSKSKAIVYAIIF